MTQDLLYGQNVSLVTFVTAPLLPTLLQKSSI